MTWASLGSAIAVAAGTADQGVGQSRLGRALPWLGDRSYSLYPVHFPIFVLLWIALWLIDLRLVSQAWTYGVLRAVIGLARPCCGRAAARVAVGSSISRSSPAYRCCQ